MAVIEKDLGPVSAYAVAVAHGYTGTEAEWEALIANSAINAQSADASATAAAASAQEATQQKTQAQAQAAAAQAHALDASRYAQNAGQANSYAQMASSNAAVSAANASNAQTAAEAAQAAAEAAVTGAEAAQTAAEAAVTDAQTAKTAAETAAATAAAAYGTDLLADDYSTSKTYDVGDYVIYSGNLYRCTTAITTAEAWTAAHWTRAQVGPDLDDLKSAVSSMNTATSEDEGKALKAKTVENGVVTKWEFGEAGGITSEIKTALLACFANVAWADENGQDYYDALESALNGPAVLLSISAVYTQTGEVLTTDSLDSLRADLVVTGTYDDETTRNITEYVLTGTLTAGTSTITAEYNGKTATFSVLVTEMPSGYTFYDYITRTETVDSMIERNSGILTDIGFSTDLILETQFRWDDSTRIPANPIMGIRGGQSGTKEFGLFYFPNYHRLGYWYDGTDSSNTTISTLTSGAVHTIKIQPVGVSQSFPQNATINVDGVDYNTNSTSTGVTFDSWLGFFKYGTSASTTSTGTDYYAGGKIGRTIIRNTGNTILHDLRPAYNGEYYGLYDMIGEKFYYYQTASMYTCANWE